MPELPDTPEQRRALRRAHERLRTASSELQALVATEPLKGRWAPEPAPPGILAAARDALEDAWEALSAVQAELLDGEARGPSRPGRIAVRDSGGPISFTFSDLMAHHGATSPGGVAHAFKVLERALPLLCPEGLLWRRELTVATSFGGPGARDGFELVTRAVSEDRYRVDPTLARDDLGATRERFVFRLDYRDRTVTLVLREGMVT
ncbi:MAG: hypothetical protein ACR2NB_06550 [Solirubrobacteraceae bacterium]